VEDISSRDPNAQEARKAPRKPRRRAKRHSTATPHKSHGRASEARREAKLRARLLNGVQQLLDDPVRFAGLKASVLAELNLTVSQAERRLNGLIEAEAKRRRSGFQVLNGGGDV
jgi:hypothetical protein